MKPDNGCSWHRYHVCRCLWRWCVPNPFEKFLRIRGLVQDISVLTRIHPPLTAAFVSCGDQLQSLLACLLALSWNGSPNSCRALEKSLTPTNPTEVPDAEDIFWDDFRVRHTLCFRCLGEVGQHLAWKHFIVHDKYSQRMSMWVTERVPARFSSFYSSI